MISSNSRRKGQNTLKLCDVIWRHRSMSTLAHVIACCLAAPSHYMHQCSLIISGVSDVLPKAISYELLKNEIHEVSLKIALMKLFPYHLPGANELMLNPPREHVRSDRPIHHDSLGIALSVKDVSESYTNNMGCIQSSITMIASIIISYRNLTQVLRFIYEET